MASSSATTIMASQTHFVSASHRLLHHPIQPKLSLLHFHTLPRSSPLSLLSATKPRSLSISAQTKTAELSETSRTSSSSQDLLQGSTRTVTTILGTTLLFLRTFQKFLPNLLHSNSAQLSSSFGSLFFASLKDRPEGFLNTPLTVVAAGLGKWLDIYSGVLMVRVLLSWFPNIPWERQPLCAIRDLCDPYLNLFRNIIPPVFDTLDVSPLLAFAVLGTLGSILHNTAGSSWGRPQDVSYSRWECLIPTLINHQTLINNIMWEIEEISVGVLLDSCSLAFFHIEERKLSIPSFSC